MKVERIKDMEQSERDMLGRIGELLDEAIVFADGRWSDRTLERLEDVRDSFRMFMESVSPGPHEDDGRIRFEVGKRYRVFQPGCTGESAFYFTILVRERVEFSDGTAVMDVDVVPCPYQNVLIPHVKAKVNVRCKGIVERVVSKMFGGDCRCLATDVAERRWC